MTEPDEAGVPQKERNQAETPGVLDARLLLQGKKEILIDHDGVVYRLRLTRRNKLILQK